MATTRNGKPRKGKARNGVVTSPETAAAKQKAAKAVELRMEGRTFDEIAKECGYRHRSSAFDAVKRALELVVREPATELIKLDLERLDKMWGIHYLNAQAGDAQALASCMKIMERRAKLLGLDAKQELEVSATVKSLPASVDDFV
jgi:hypothetical protein